MKNVKFECSKMVASVLAFFQETNKVAVGRNGLCSQTFITGPNMKKQLLIFFHSPEFDVVSVSCLVERQVFQARAQMSGMAKKDPFLKAIRLFVISLSNEVYYILSASDFANIGTFIYGISPTLG